MMWLKGTSHQNKQQFKQGFKQLFKQCTVDCLCKSDKKQPGTAAHVTY